MVLVVWVRPFDCDTSSIDEAIQSHRRFQVFNLLDDLVHLVIGQRVIVKSVDASIVIK